MANPILVPQVGQDLTEGKVVGLFVKPGDTVKKGDVVAEVESEKASFEVEAFDSGVVLDVLYKVGDLATVLEPLMFLGQPGESLAKAELEPSHSIAEVMPAIAVTEARSDEVHRSSPLARRLAARAGLDLSRLAGTGTKGAVVKRDIDAALAARGNAPVAPVAPAPVAAVTADASRLAIKTLQNGTGDPVVFLHGFGAELAAWRPFVPHVGVGNPMLALDLPAHGALVDQPIADFDMLVDSVAAALTAAGLTRLHLVGHSLGAAVATALAASGSLNVRSLSLIAPAGLGPKINGDFIAGFLAATSEPALKSWMTILVRDPANLPGAMVRATLSGRDGTNVAANQARLAAGIFAGSTQLFSVREALARFGGPVRIIVGREDPIIPPEHSDLLPGHVALHRLPQVGHLPQLEAAALAGRLVAETVRAAG
ncbi:acetoin dehydrogenase dihydrolipoyllysine-residue acetyltransferase subunit [Starkeya sp. ORNL1]|uniref:acetoin dehydrogenase dihydrolipoyllysine-residue acetyltransferase subunit n=1 Tax=Starkeya sp. ORNL1 TaxID=2709380 RepID=UPI001463DD07|nr:acetoin dehydrogenase dihydrolipoyllysine-residue acetyltransferase subunit [Starkeya sp. ORNL1]QJP16389.1 acetoin dehydrogenase dihydrolipoyllysine-residue acetyltransferase subunit [Starkeya sp. ORNL1]